MKIVLILTILAPLTWGAPVNPLLKCLAQEEAQIHQQKLYNHRYHLNQEFFNSLASDAYVYLKEDLFERICQKNAHFGPAENLLFILLTEGQKAFSFKEENYHLQKASVSNLLELLPQLLFQYLSNLQAQAPTPDCLEKNIPEAKYFMEQFRYLEGEIPTSQILGNKDKIRRLFEALKNYQQMFNRCQKPKKKD